jgi:SAM-dependent methyltransferase
MTTHDDYFTYLQGRSRLGAFYRRRWLYPRLEQRLRGACLDVGCGIGDMLVHRANTVGVDINPRTVAFCQARGATAVVMERDQLPFDGGRFESALLDNVLEHLEQPGPLLAEVRRVLKSGGQALVGVPGRRGWASDADHKVFYDEAGLTRCLAEAGFELVELFHAPLWRSRWLDQHVRQYCVYGLFRRS